jgi:hypothetical protein
MSSWRLVPSVPSEASQALAVHINGTPFLGPILEFEGVRIARLADGSVSLRPFHKTLHAADTGPEISGAAYPEFGEDT